MHCVIVLCFQIEEDDYLATAEALTLSALTTNDMKEKRQHDYKFQWQRALQSRGDTGIYLQSTHAKLCNLERTFPDLMEKLNMGKLDFELAPSFLTGPEANRLTESICKFGMSIEKAYSDLEPCHLLQGLYSVCRAAGTANAKLKVQGVDGNEAVHRLFLLVLSKNLLACGLKLLGLERLDKM